MMRSATSGASSSPKPTADRMLSNSTAIRSAHSRSSRDPEIWSGVSTKDAKNSACAARRASSPTAAEPLGCELADRLQHPKRSPDGGGGSSRRATGGRRGRASHTSSAASRVQPPAKTASRANSSFSSSVRRSWTTERRSQRLLAGVGVATALEQVEAMAEPVEDLRRREDAGPGGRELDGERQVVERRQSSAIVSSGPPRAVAEELDTLRLRERWNRVVDLARDPQEFRLVTRILRFGQVSSNTRDVRRRLHHLLEVVEQEQELALADVVDEAILGAQRLRDRLDHERGSRSARGRPRRRPP